MQHDNESFGGQNVFVFFYQQHTTALRLDARIGKKSKKFIYLVVTCCCLGNPTIKLCQIFFLFSSYIY